MKHVTLSSGQPIPMLGLGTWKMFDGSAYAAVKSAIDLGYRHFDCAWVYENEKDIGRIFAESIADQKISRDDIFVTSKLWNDKHRPEDVADALKGTLSDLQLEYLDLYLIHWPIAHKPGIMRPDAGSEFESLVNVPLSATWSALAECQAVGLCRNIGVANFSISKIEALISETHVKPSCLQVESHPFLQQNELFEYCRQKDIVYVAYSPLGSGDRPDRLKSNNEPRLFENEVLKGIANARKITVAQVMLAWAVNRGTIPIPKSSSPERQKQNLQAAEIELSEEEMTAIAGLEQSHRYVDGSFWEHADGPYTAAGIWA